MRAPGRGALTVAIVFALLCFGMSLFVWLSFGGSIPLQPKGYRFQVRFGPEATNLVAGSQVRIAGIPVGRVADTEKTRGSVSSVIELEAQYAPIPNDARAIVRSKTLLGENFVELTPGSPTAPKVPENGALPVRNVVRATTIDQVLGTFDEPTRERFRELLGALDDAFAGRSEELSAILGNSGPTTEDLETLTAILDRQRPALRSLVRDSATALKAIGGRRAALQSLVTAGDEVLGTTAARDNELTETVRALPRMLTSLRGAMAEADRAVALATPTVRRLRPAASSIRPALEASIRLAPQVERLLAELEPAIRELRPALPAALRILRRATPLMRALDPAGRELVPVVQVLNEYRREVVASMANVGAASNGFVEHPYPVPGPDGTPQHYVRAVPPVTTEQIFGYPRRLPTNRSNPYRRPGGIADLGAGGLKAFDCRNAGNPATAPALGSAPPCLAQEPYSFLGGPRRSYPHVERWRPTRAGGPRRRGPSSASRATSRG